MLRTLSWKMWMYGPTSKWSASLRASWLSRSSTASFGPRSERVKRVSFRFVVCLPGQQQISFFLERYSQTALKTIFKFRPTCSSWITRCYDDTSRLSHRAVVRQWSNVCMSRILQVLKWYNDINSFILDYISVSIKDSDVSDFYRYVIGFKNLLRSVEFSGKSGIFGLR
jgi:hypothetical protein